MQCLEAIWYTLHTAWGLELVCTLHSAHGASLQDVLYAVPTPDWTSHLNQPSPGSSVPDWAHRPAAHAGSSTRGQDGVDAMCSMCPRPSLCSMCWLQSSQHILHAAHRSTLGWVLHVAHMLAQPCTLDLGPGQFRFTELPCVPDLAHWASPAWVPHAAHASAFFCMPGVYTPQIHPTYHMLHAGLGQHFWHAVHRTRARTHCQQHTGSVQGACHMWCLYHISPMHWIQHVGLVSEPNLVFKPALCPSLLHGARWGWHLSRSHPALGLQFKSALNLPTLI